MPKPEDIAFAFQDAINLADLSALSRLMAPDHRFVDKVGNMVSGQQDSLAAWQAFFAAFPDYANHVEDTVVRNTLVVMRGRSACSEPLLAGPALWTARVSGSQITEWRVWEDSAENRSSISL